GSVSPIEDYLKPGGVVLLSSVAKQKAIQKIAAEANAPVWTDVYAIDQSNPEFKNAQVSIMFDVYSKAELCHVILDSDDAAMFKLVIATLHGLGTPMFIKMLCDMDDNPTANLNNPFSLAYSVLLAKVEYSHRVWTLQEVHSSKAMKYYNESGNEILDSDELLLFAAKAIAMACSVDLKVDQRDPDVIQIISMTGISPNSLKTRAANIQQFAHNVLRAFAPGTRDAAQAKLDSWEFGASLGADFKGDNVVELIVQNFDIMSRLSVGFRNATHVHDYVYGIAAMANFKVPVDYSMNVTDVAKLARQEMFALGLRRIEIAAPTWAIPFTESNVWSLWECKYAKLCKWEMEFPAPVLIRDQSGSNETVS
ncbi:hypothetical protein HDU99_006704, partial [Rhizoclosmatium hyalinum]